MKNPNGCPLGIAVFAEPAPNRPRTVAYPTYLREILAHAGLCYRELTESSFIDELPRLRVLLTVGEVELDQDARDALQRWLEQGGAWISIAGLCGMAPAFGVEPAPCPYAGWGTTGGVQLGEGYFAPTNREHPTIEHLDISLHYFNGLAATPTDVDVLAEALDAHQRATGRVALAHRRVGQGRTFFIAPDLTGTVVRIQQGVAITRDGVPSDDGTAPVCDHVLKSDDGGVLDWHFDRQPVEGVPGLSAFLRPVADQWRQLLLRTIFTCATDAGLCLPVLWLYPRRLPAIAHMSHDTDENDPAKARALLAVLASAGVNTTWCTIAPGYDPAIIEQVRAAGHELALHFDALSPDAPWSSAALSDQHEQLTRLFDGQAPVSNKNHYLRWQGDTEFFNWCETVGIELDQSKGPSKPGCAGFGFGTCHPYFPVDPGNDTIDVLELPTLAQDLAVFIPPVFARAAIEPVLRSHGVLHLLFHPAHVDKPGVAEAIRASIDLAQQHGMPWWTAAQINAWERARRKMDWLAWREDNGQTTVSFRSGAPLTDATLLFLGAEHDAPMLNGEGTSASTLNCWGFDFTAMQLDIHPGQTHTVTFARKSAVGAR